MNVTYATFRELIVGFTAVVTGAYSLWIALRPTRSASRLGMRGLKRQRALLDPMWATVEPTVRWTGVRVSGILSDKSRAKLDRGLTHAGDFLGLTADEYFGLVVLNGLVFTLIGGIATYFDSRVAPLIPVLAIVGATCVVRGFADAFPVGRARLYKPAEKLQRRAEIVELAGSPARGRSPLVIGSGAFMQAGPAEYHAQRVQRERIAGIPRGRGFGCRDRVCAAVQRNQASRLEGKRSRGPLK
jgi:hypothetical protein